MRFFHLSFPALLLAMSAHSVALDIHWSGDTIINSGHKRLYDIDPNAKSVCFEIVGQATNRQLQKGAISVVWNYGGSEELSSASLWVSKNGYSDPLIDSRNTRLTISGISDDISLPERKATTFVLGITLERDSAQVDYIDDGENLVTRKVAVGNNVREIGFSSSTDFHLRRATLVNEPQPPHPEKSAWTRPELDDYLSKSTDPIEGYWRLLDYNIDDNLARIAGRYTVAIIRRLTSNDYDIIYIDGAVTNSTLWHPCDIKGRLFPTEFIRHFNLQWYAADAGIIATDTNASVDDTSMILTLNFPLLRSQIRFSRIPR